MVLAVGALMTRMPLHPLAQRGDLALPLVARRTRGVRVLAVGLLEVAELSADPGVLREVAAIARHRALVPGERLLLLAHLAGEPDDGAVGLELRERRLEDLARPPPAELVDEVDRHVVRRAEARVERIRAARRERGDRLRVEPLGPLDHRVTLDVDASSAGAAGDLGVLPRGDRDAGFAVELLELLEHDGARGHVDAEGERLGREDDLDELALEEILDDLLEGGKEPGVMRGDAALEVVEPFPVAEHGEVLVEQRAGALLDGRADLEALLVRGQPDARPPHLLHGGIAAGAAEDEEDRRQQVAPLEQLDDVRTVEALDPLHVRRAHGSRAALAGASTGCLVTPRRRAVHRLRAPIALVRRPLERADPHELLIDLCRRDPGSIVEERQDVAPHQHVLLERDRPDLRDDDVGVAAHGVEPVAELLGVRHRRRQRDESHVGREVDDHFLPHGAAEAVGEVVHLVHHDVAEAAQRRGVGVEHVAQHLGRHDDHARIAVDVRVAREESHVVRAVDLDELAELLVRQRLHGRRVERLRGMPALDRLAHREVDRELADDRLAGAGGRGDEHAASLFERRGIRPAGRDRVRSAGMPRSRR